jgi:hypothetical protein
MGERRTPGYTVRTSKVGPGLPRVQAEPLEWDPDPPCMGFGPPTMGSQGSRIEHTRAWNKTQARVRCRHVSRPRLVCIHSCSPLRRRPDAATRTIARDVSQRTEPGVKPLGYTAPAFIVDKMSACPFQWQALCSSLLACYQGNDRRLSILRGPRPSRRPVITQVLLVLIIHIMCFIHYAPGPTCRGSAPLYVPPLNYEREGTQRYRLTHKSSKLSRLTSTQAYTLNTTYTVEVGFYALAA